MSNKLPVPPNRLKQFGAIFLVLLVVQGLLWLSLSPDAPKGSPLPMGIFLDEVAAGTIKPAEIVTADNKPYWHAVNGFKGTEQFRSEGRLTDENLTALRKFGPEEKLIKTKGFGSIFLDLLPTLLFLGFFLFLLKGLAKRNPAFSHGKMNVKSNEKSKIKFTDVAGCDEAKEEVKEIVDFLKDPASFKDMGGTIPKGVLLVGPPGTGKTLLARAVAGEANCPFISISGSDFIELFVGVGASRVRDLFAQAKKQAPCIIFIDEIDAVAKARTNGGNTGGSDERDQTVNALLVEMDGFSGNEGVIIFAATNRPETLDSALLRPGRFDRQVTVPLPDLKGRIDILKVYAPQFKLGEDVNIEAVAKNATGFSGAELKNLLNEAALHATRKKIPAITMTEISEARDKLRWGRERKMLMDDKDKEVIAVHEAGHAIARVALNIKHNNHNLTLDKVTIIPRGQSLGSTIFTPQKDLINYSKEDIENQIICTMGGRVAEELLLNQITSGASGDIRQVSSMARHMVYDYGMSPLGFMHISPHIQEPTSQDMLAKADKYVQDIIAEKLIETRELLTTHKDKLLALKEELKRIETVDGAYVTALFDIKPTVTV